MMKNLLIFTFLFTTLFVSAQQINIEQWNKEAATNIRLLPRYGDKEKTKQQKEADKNFIDNVLNSNQFETNNTAASNKYIQLGFYYLYKKDLKTAMYRFNQAYLLEPLNTDIYWGYGAVYVALGDFERAEKQYLEGLSINPNNPRLLTDYAFYFTEKSNGEKNYGQQEKVSAYLEKAIDLMVQPYDDDRETLIKLSTSYYLKEDCVNALRYYKEYELLVKNPTTEEEEYIKLLDTKCNIK